MERRLKWPPLPYSCPRVVYAWLRRGLEARVPEECAVREGDDHQAYCYCPYHLAVEETLSKAYPFLCPSNPMPSVQRLSVTSVQLVC